MGMAESVKLYRFRFPGKREQNTLHLIRGGKEGIIILFSQRRDIKFSAGSLNKRFLSRCFCEFKSKGKLRAHYFQPESRVKAGFGLHFKTSRDVVRYIRRH